MTSNERLENSVCQFNHHIFSFADSTSKWNTAAIQNGAQDVFVTASYFEEVSSKSIKIKSSALLCYKARMDENEVIISSTEIIKG